MPTTTIQADGKILVETTPAEEALLAMVCVELGAGVLDAVINLHYKRLVESTMSTRFAKLSPQDAAAVLEKFAGK